MKSVRIMYMHLTDVCSFVRSFVGWSVVAGLQLSVVWCVSRCMLVVSRPSPSSQSQAQHVRSYGRAVRAVHIALPGCHGEHLMLGCLVGLHMCAAAPGSLVVSIHLCNSSKLVRLSIQHLGVIFIFRFLRPRTPSVVRRSKVTFGGYRHSNRSRFIAR